MPLRTIARPPAGNVAFPPTSPPTFRGGSSFRGVLDGLEITSSLLGAWSVARRLRMPYVGPAIRLRRSSDSAEQDFYGIGPQGEVSTSDVRAWNGWNTARSTDDISNASIWARTNVTTTTDTIADNATNAQHYITDIAGLVVATGQVETGTVEMKAGTSSWGYLFLDGSSAFFNLATGTVGTIGSGLTATITDVGDGWYRCRVTKTRVNAVTTFRIGITTADNVLSYAGTGSTIQVRRIQLERASSFSTYEPRTTTSAGDSFLVTLYDQTGLGRHATQSTTTLQRIVCEQGVPVTAGGRLASRSVAADARRAAIGSSTSMFNQVHTTGGTLFLVEQTNDTAAAKVVMGNQTATNTAGFRITRTSTEAVSTTVGRVDVAGVATNGNSISVAAHADSSQLTNTIKVFSFDPGNATAASRLSLWINGTVNATANAESGTPFVENASGNMTFGAAPDGSSAHDGLYVESALFGSVISTTDRTTLQSRSGNFFTVTIA